ncbi:hypothetical protein PIIN_10640, partial [Serendipita indica DSM 11827]
TQTQQRPFRRSSYYKKVCGQTRKDVIPSRGSPATRKTSRDTGCLT